MKLTVSILLYAHSALAFVVHGSVLDHSYVPLLGGQHLQRSQPLIPIVGNLTNAQAEAGYAAMCSSAGSSTGSAAVLGDINNVTVNALAIETEFRNVAAQLAFIDSENLDPQKFSANWAALSQQWTNILWASRDTASDTVVYCQEFIDTIMPFVVNASGVSVPPVFGIRALQEYIEEAQTLETNAQATANAFTSLQTNITIFAASFGNFALKLKASDDTKIDSLLVSIAALNQTIHQLNQEISEVAVAMGITIFADLTAAVIFPGFAPLIIGAGVLAVAGEGAAWGVLINQRNQAASSFSQDQATLQQLQLQETAIVQANSTLHTISNVTIPTMVNQLQAFNIIWNAVVSDCQQGISYLTLGTNTLNQNIPQIFWSTINHVPCIYEQVVGALNLYASGIASSSIPPATMSELSLNRQSLSSDQFHAKVQSIISKASSKAAALSEGQTA